MKTTKNLLATIALLIIAKFSFAVNAPNHDQNDLLKFRKLVTNQIGFPSKIKNANGKEAIVHFEINNNLKPQICKVETQSPEIEHFIKSEFEKMQLPTQFAKLNETYIIKIKFISN